MDLTPAAQETSTPTPAEDLALSLPSREASSTLRKFELFLLLAISVGPSLVSAAFVYFLFFDAKQNQSLPSYVQYGLTMAVIHQGGGLALLLYILWRQGRSLRDIGFSFRWSDIPVSLGLLVLSWLAAGICRAFANSVYHLWTGRHVERWDGAAAMLGAHVSIIVVVFLVLNAFYEELIVRAYVMSEIISWKKSAPLAGAVSVTVQSLYHIYQGVPNMIAVAGLFSIYAAYYGKTRRILPVVLAHLYVDAISAAFLFHSHH